MAIRRQAGALVQAFAVALAVDAVWLALSAETGKTYHLAPLIAGAAPGVLLRGRLRLRWLGLGAGALAVAVGWLAIVLAGIEPIATIFAREPGGVTGEVAFLGLLGLAVGAGYGPAVAHAQTSRQAVSRGPAAYADPHPT